MKVYRLSALKKPLNITRGEHGEPVYVTHLSKIVQEIIILAHIEHPNIVRLYRVIEIPEKDKLYLIMQHAEHGPVLNWSPAGENHFTVNPSIGDKSLTSESLKMMFKAVASTLAFRILISPLEAYRPSGHQARKYLR